jgi:hypothetical protein
MKKKGMSNNLTLNTQSEDRASEAEIVKDARKTKSRKEQNTSML